MIVGSGIAGAAAFAGGDAPAATAVTPMQAADAGQMAGIVSGSRVAGWVGLAAGVALLIAGAFALFPYDATGTPASPAESTGPTSPDVLGSETDSRADDTTVVGSGPDASTPEVSRLPDGESTVSPDDTTPNWKLRD